MIDTLPHQNPLIPVSLVDRVYARLRQAIFEGEILPGAKISEPELARAYEISRSSLREAIAKLVSRGLVVRQANIGARVVELSNAGLMELYQIRESIEGLAARLAAQNMTNEELETLQVRMHHHGSDKSVLATTEYRAADFDFHYDIVTGSHNQRLITMASENLFELIQLYRSRYDRSSPRTQYSSYVEHSQIFNAIVRKDGEMAELMMRNHIRAAGEHAKKFLI